MPPMASPPVKRKWSELLDDDFCEKQLLMDLCAAKLRYVNPPRPPKRRTEVPLLRSVLIVNAMKHLSSEMKVEKPIDSSTEDLSVDPGHFEGLPPLSELLTDIMLDPQPLSPNGDTCYQQPASTFNWSSTSSPHYSPITPVQPSLPSYLDGESLMETSEDEKTVHNLLPCTSVISTDPDQSSSGSWEPHANILDSFLSDTSNSHLPSDNMVNFSSDFTFQPPRNPLPSFTSFFDSTHSSVSYSEFTQTSTHYSSVSTATSLLPSTSTFNFPLTNFASSEDAICSANFSESELEILAKTFSAKLPTLSIEELVHALPQSPFSQQMSQPSQSPFHVPSALQSSSSGIDSNPTASNQCASYCRKDQPAPNVDEGSMVRVLVNL